MTFFRLCISQMFNAVGLIVKSLTVVPLKRSVVHTSSWRHGSCGTACAGKAQTLGPLQRRYPYYIFIYLYIYICSMFNIFQFQWEAVLTWYVGVACNCMWIWYIIYINRCTKYELAFPLATKNQRANELRPESHWFTWKLVNMTPPQGPDMKWYDLYKQHNKKKHGFPKKNPFFFVWSWFFKLEEHHFTDLKYQVSGWVVCNHL